MREPFSHCTGKCRDCEFQRGSYLDAVISRLLASGCVHHRYCPHLMREIFERAEQVLDSETTLLKLKAPIIVCGDIHGHYHDLLRIFRTCGTPIKQRYLFLGNYVDRGAYSLEVIVLLLLYKIQYPQQVILLRGCHERPSVLCQGDFFNEIRQLYVRPDDWESIYNGFIRVFSLMPIAAVLSDKIFCVHGGLTSKIESLEQIMNIKRPMIEPDKLSEAMLTKTLQTSITGLNDSRIQSKSKSMDEETNNKLNELGVDCIFRGHQLVDGYSLSAEGRVITLYSASSLHKSFNNAGAIAKVSESLEISFIRFSPCSLSNRSCAALTQLVP